MRKRINNTNCATCNKVFTDSNCYKKEWDGELRFVKHCKSCISKVNRVRHASKVNKVQSQNKPDSFSVYHLPAEYYVGISSNPQKRIKDHKYRYNKDITDAHIIAVFDTVQEALQEEARYHSMGYKGCSYANEPELNRELYTTIF